MPSSTLLPPPGPLQPGIRRLTTGLMLLGMAQLAFWLGSAIQNFYGTRLLVLTVHAGRKFVSSHPHLVAMLPSPAGIYTTGTQGDLLYQPTAFSDYFLFYHLGSFTCLDALFMASVGIYLYYALGRLPLERAFTPAASRAMVFIGLASCLMYTLTLAVNILAYKVFEARTQALFMLDSQCGASMLYVVLGLVLGVCGRFFERGQQLQRESELTI